MKLAILAATTASLIAVAAGVAMLRVAACGAKVDRDSTDANCPSGDDVISLTRQQEAQLYE